MSEIEVIQQTLVVTANRKRWQSALNGFGLGLFLGAILSLTALVVFKLFPVPYRIIIDAVAVAILLTLILSLRGWSQKPTLTQTARWLDRRERLQERLSTALELAEAKSDAGWHALLLTDAARVAREVNPSKLLPFRLPHLLRWAALALALCAGLGFVPEYRSKAFREKQQDLKIIKDAGHQLASVMRRSLEQHPSAPAPTQQALKDAEDVGLKLNQGVVTRNEALKDLANVADKLRQQLKDMGAKNPSLAAVEKAEEKAQRDSASGSKPNDALQKQIDALKKSLGKAAEDQAALDKMNDALQKAKHDMDSMPKGDSADAKAAREKLAQTLSDIARQSQQLGQPMPDLEKAIAALKANKPQDFQRDLGQATQDVEKMQETEKALQQMQQQQSEQSGKDLPEQLKKGQADTAQQSLQKMMNDLRSGNVSQDQASKMMDELSRSISPATPYADAGKFLQQASDQLKKGDKSGAANSLAQASAELEKVASQMSDAKELAAAADAMDQAEQTIATRRNFGQNGKNGTWSDEDSQLYPRQGSLWGKRGWGLEPGPRTLTDRGEPQLADSLAPTRLHGQISPGGPMPSINLKGVSIKGQSGVQYQEVEAAAQTDAQNALSQDQVPRAYQGAVRDYFDDLKK